MGIYYATITLCFYALLMHLIQVVRLFQIFLCASRKRIISVLTMLSLCCKYETSCMFVAS